MIISNNSNCELAATKLKQLNGDSSNGETGATGSANPTDGTLWAESAFGGFGTRPSILAAQRRKSGGTLKLLSQFGSKRIQLPHREQRRRLEYQVIQPSPSRFEAQKAVTKYGPGSPLIYNEVKISSPISIACDRTSRHQPALSENETFDWLSQERVVLTLGVERQLS